MVIKDLYNERLVDEDHIVRELSAFLKRYPAGSNKSVDRNRVVLEKSMHDMEQMIAQKKK